MAKILDGKQLANNLNDKLKRKVVKLKRLGVTPGLAVILVGNNPASSVYVRNKQIVSKYLGLNFYLKKFNSTVSNKTLFLEIKKLNKDKKVHGIILQLPLPKKLDTFKLLLAIDPLKDVDGLHPVNLGLLALNKPIFIPATPKGIIDILNHYNIHIKSKHVVLIGFGKVVGMPLSLLLANHQATVSIAQDTTRHLDRLTKQADILITATGKPKLIKGNMLKKGVVIIDAGISKVKSKFVGDVDEKSVSLIAKYITPVPGGVGPMTVSSLMHNVINSASRKDILAPVK